jgi:hypothetical protein
MPLVWTVVIGLAAFRLYRISGKDDITQGFHGTINAAARKNSVAFVVNELISCAWCIGSWYSAALAGAGYLLGLFGAVEAFGIGLAASAVCGIVERIDQAIEAIARRVESEDLSRLIDAATSRMQEQEKR